MVKFLTDTHVYVVAGDSRLQWVQSESVAQDLYGMDWRMKMTEIRMPTDMVHEIVKNADAALDAARLSFVNHKPLTSEEWRQIMQIITYTRVCCTNAIRKETND